MDGLNASLARLLLDDFHITSASSMRQDQWYKRTMKSWKEANLGDVLILTPKDARTEWAPKINRFAKDLTDAIREVAQQERESLADELPELGKGRDRVFDDATITKNPPSCFFDGDDGRLGYAEQNLSYWITRSGAGAPGSLSQRAHSVKKLLERHESRGLLALTTGHADILRTLAELSEAKRNRQGLWEAQQGWLAALDETLEVSIFIIAILSFPKELLDENGYARWSPSMRSYPGHPAIWRYLGNQGFCGIESADPQVKGLTSRKLKDHLDWHLRTLSIAVMVTEACQIEHNPPLQDRIVNAFLHLTGFEAWNREREVGEGNSYLACKLNQGKSAKWLRGQVSGEGREEVHKEDGPSNQEDSGKEAAGLPRKKKDPLKLGEPGQNSVEVSSEDDSDSEEGAKLAVLEAEEARYGTKRSTKYRRRDE
ncbi:hypothetical protein PG995_008630 [Apiospora arundinis]